MLRIGKNPKDSVENEISPEKPEVSSYTTPRTYNSYQAPAPEVKPQPEYTSASPKALTESESLAREIKEGNLSGFVGSGTVVTGEANFKAMMRVDGHLSGRINSTSGTLIVGANGKVDANIEVAVAIIHGTINGDIIATQRLELGRAAKLNGNIQTASLMIEPGALFEGTCKMIKMNAGASKGKSNGRDEQPLDTTSMKPINADASEKPTEIANVSSVAS
ncbi:MAG TPA: polymer-forming cytoskeletal protein [Pyrinomonadaceae bacterium]|jgi:cytoskeletal protein CcmA (bactofilin family)|nr:polymer-forming cytoskeletal protein [Pyrinomonadaceae bacterium]